MSRYTFGVRRKAAIVAEPEPEPTYRELQAEAKEAGIPANQSADELKAALEDSDDE